MGRLNLKYKIIDGNDELSQKDFASFGPAMLEVGELSTESSVTQGVAAIFDLEGFTDFCNQIDPHLVVPEFLQDFLTWLFKNLGEQMVESSGKGRIILFCRLPFFAKFMGDGVLFLWDTKQMSTGEMADLVVSLYNVCNQYSQKYHRDASRKFAKVPKRLRCGVARGQLIALGDGRDYVGACINVAARLQKLANLTFAFSRRGFDLKKHFKHCWQQHFELVQAPIRGIGEKDPVYVVSAELAALPEEQRSLFT